MGDVVAIRDKRLYRVPLLLMLLYIFDKILRPVIGKGV